MIPRLSFQESELLAVPAVHNRSVFAEQVNRACRDDATRPDAIAVELSHDAVCAVVTWLRELGAGRGCAEHIPCMLGLMKSNRRIHPRHRKTAIHLQEEHGLPLHKIRPEILRQQLNFAHVSLLCLTTTDSMIEAIRVATELEIPVHGIDLGEIANAERGQSFILDPLLAQGDLTSYLRRIEICSGLHRDDVIDGRRERVMAARLKRLLQQYRRVFFTGGLGHWQELRRHLSDPMLRPALDPSRSEAERFTRVLVSPSLAIHQMDLFPDLTDRYEAVRQLPLNVADRLIDYGAFYRTKLASAFECAEPRNRDAVDAFSRYLTNLSLIQQRRLPNLFMILHVARVMISPAFATRLGEALVIKALKWAVPDEWPSLPYLCEVAPGHGESDVPSPGQRAQLLGAGERSAPFFLADMGGHENRTMDWRLPPLIDPATEDELRKRRRRSCFDWVWPPCETLLFGTAYEGVRVAERNRRARSPEPFAGSLHHGVDVKATLRAVIRGERRVHVKADAASVLSPRSGADSDEPTVFLFERESAVIDGRWETFLACYGSDVRRLARDTARYEQIARQHGDSFVTSVSFGAEREPRAALRNHVARLWYLYGIVVFGNPCLNPQQAVRWLENTDYARCPILRWSGMSNLLELYRRQHKMTLDRERWVSRLIRLALPYARQRVTVIMPSAQTVPDVVFRETAARKIRLEIVPLNHFAKQRIETIRHQYFVKPNDADATEYSDELQAAFGESPAAHLELLPEHIRAQLDRES